MRIPGAFALAYPLEILVVNDGKPELASTKLHLHFLGYEPDQALSASEMIEMVNNKQYDLILSDGHGQLPMCRKEFLAQLKSCSEMAGKS